jgi:hypothetical protein
MTVSNPKKAARKNAAIQGLKFGRLATDIDAKGGKYNGQE